MADQQHNDQQLKSILEQVESLEDDFPAEVIEQTAIRLEKLQYAPPVAIDIPRFLRLDRVHLKKEIEQIIAAVEQGASDVVGALQTSNVILYYYKKLQLLRGDDPESWDEIDELYVHD